MRVLLVYPEFPNTYWGFQYGLPLAGKRSNLPPLGLITVAAMLPADWELRLIDLNIEPLPDDLLNWADVVLTGGMRVQIPSTDWILRRAAELGKRTVVGGPAVSTDPTLFAQADVRVIGEVEGVIDEVVTAIRIGARGTTVTATDFPVVQTSPVPRFDLLDLSAYGSVSIQYSRGCPFACEFCDIIQLFGRVPRVKSADQILAELNSLYALGHRGSLFFVDDNFIGNQKAVKELLPAVTTWQRERGYPYNFATEASINLASRSELLSGMVQAGFNSVFVGIETPSLEALKGAGKTQNLSLGADEAVRRISAAGLEVMGGFIVGFDSDTPEIFEAQRALILGSPVPLAMLGLLMALPKTALWDRLEREGRLRVEGSGDHGDQFGRPNFEPAMDEKALLSGYATLLATLYSRDAYYDRIEAFVRMCGPLPGGGRRPRVSDLATLARLVTYIGVASPQRWRFWRLVATTLRHRPERFAWAMSRVIIGEHMIRYTAEDVLPRLRLAEQMVSAQEVRLIA